MLSIAETRHIAKLARIQLNDKEIAKFRPELIAVLEYFEILREVDVSETKGATYNFSLRNSVRQDEANLQKAEIAKLLVAMAPASEHGYVKVKSILP